MTMIYAEEARVSEEHNDDLLEPQQAATYLSELWGRPFKTRDFLNMRTNAVRKARRLHVDISEVFPIRPAFGEGRFSIWRRSDIELLAQTMKAPRLREKTYGKPKKLDTPNKEC